MIGGGICGMVRLRRTKGGLLAYLEDNLLLYRLITNTWRYRDVRPSESYGKDKEELQRRLKE